MGAALLPACGPVRAPAAHQQNELKVALQQDVFTTRTGCVAAETHPSGGMTLADNVFLQLSTR